MTAKQLAAVRLFHQRNADGDYVFISRCLDGTRGHEAKMAAETAVQTAVDMDHLEDDTTTADVLMALVESDEERQALP